MNRIRCVIFDMDGTLTDTHRLIFDSFNHIVEEYRGGRMSDLEIAALFGPPEEGALIPIVGEQRLGEAFTKYLNFYRSNHASLAGLFPGIREILFDLRKSGVILGLFTGKGRHTTSISLDEVGLTGIFDRIVTGNDVKEHKPSGEGIERILRECGVSGSETVMVGDSPADIRAARDARVPIIAVRWDEHSKKRKLIEAVDFQFDTTREFGAWIRTATSQKAN